MTEFSQAATERLLSIDVDPLLAAAVEDLQETSKEGTLGVICRRSGWPVLHEWTPGDPPHPWSKDEPAPAVFWPVGKGSTVIVCLGATAGLWWLARLFHLGTDGAIYRKPSLPPVLAEAVPAVLPETAPWVSEPWLSHPRGADRGPEELFGELISDDLAEIVLAINSPKPTSDFEEAHGRFEGRFVRICADCGVLPSILRLPEGHGWNEAFAGYQHAGLAWALAGAIEMARQQAIGSITFGDPEASA